MPLPPLSGGDAPIASTSATATTATGAAQSAASTPGVLHQTWQSRTLPYWIAAEREALRRANPTYRFELWDDSDCEHFMRSVAPPWVRDAYFSIRPELGAARADVWRYALLHHCGGVYLDIDSTLMRPLDSWLNASAAVVSCEANRVRERDVQLAQRLNLSTLGLVRGGCRRAQWLLAAPARHPLLLQALRFVADNLGRYRDGLEPRVSMHDKVTFLTGPMVWTRAVSHYHSVRLPPSPDGAIVHEYDGIDFGGNAAFGFDAPHNESAQMPLHCYNRLDASRGLKVGSLQATRQWLVGPPSPPLQPPQSACVRPAVAQRRVPRRAPATPRKAIQKAHGAPLVTSSAIVIRPSATTAKASSAADLVWRKDGVTTGKRAAAGASTVRGSAPGRWPRYGCAIL